MMTIEKKDLINECIRLSKDYPNKVAYGFICKDGKTHATVNEWCIRERIYEGAKIYCKAQDGYMIL